MPTVIVDGKEVEIGAGERLNGIQVAQRAGVDVPHYCWHAGLSVVASCRMCLVETGKKDAATGKIQMMPKLVPACQTPATDGTVFVTNSESVQKARAMVEEDLLLRHPVDCSICDKAGECSLQDYHFEYGRDERRADIKPFHSRRRDLGDTITLFVDRCVMCTRCVRFTREISGTAELMVANRGAHEEIDVFPGFPLDNKLSGNVSDICPVGALGDVDFLYSQRVWFMKSHDGVCAGCSTGCSIRVDENQDRIYRLKPRENAHVNQWWMCDDGRYGWKHVHDAQRVVGPTKRVDKNGQSTTTNVEWSDAPQQLDGELRAAGKLAAVLSPFLTVEEAYLLATYVRSIDPQALLVLGAIPVVGEDESYPKGFTIRAEKCPNRKGVTEVIAGLAGQVITWDEFLTQHLPSGKVQGVWVAGGSPDAATAAWTNAAVAEKFADVKLLIVQDLFSSPLMEAAHWRLPAAAFAERDGSYVNHADRLQSFEWAIRAPSGVKVEGHLLWQLTGRTGLFRSRPVLDDVARAIGYFAAATAPIPGVGLDLKVNQLAGVS
ncbi:MAG: 2Fe-2S iron-sulfur cluster-binding protein [Pirellulales bacterium]